MQTVTKIPINCKEIKINMKNVLGSVVISNTMYSTYSAANISLFDK